MILLGKNAVDAEHWDKCVDQLSKAIEAIQSDLMTDDLAKISDEKAGIEQLELLYRTYGVDPKVAGMDGSSMATDMHSNMVQKRIKVEELAATHLNVVFGLVQDWLETNKVPDASLTTSQDEGDNVLEERAPFTPLLTMGACLFKQVLLAGSTV
jgi:hypothetical protein